MKKIVSVIMALSLTGCAGKVLYQPVIDDKKVDMSAYHGDLKECQDLAQKSYNDALTGAIILGILGATAGSAIGSPVGLGNEYAAMGAAAGAATGAGAGYASDVSKEREIVDNCLKGRGYKVLGRR